MKKAIIITGNLVQDHEFIYPYYRLLEEGFEIDVCILEGKPVQGILGTSIPPNKDQIIKKIEEVKVDDYSVLVLPGGVKAMEKVRQQNKTIIVKILGITFFNIGNSKYLKYSLLLKLSWLANLKCSEGINNHPERIRRTAKGKFINT